MRLLTELGFKYFPLSHTGVPEIVKESRPVGLESELNALLDVTEYFLNTRLNENLLVVVVGEYGWGKTELLDYYVSTLQDKYRDKVEIARIPLTFELSVRHVKSVLERRSGKPLILIVDEADELSRVYALSRDRAGELAKIVTELATAIRAVLEPRQYSSVLGLPLTKLTQILLIVAVTPHLYFEILKSSVPDIFDLTIGRVYREIIIRSDIPLWLYHAIIIEKLRAASTRERATEIAKGKLDALYPLKFEYLASLYYILYLQERGKPSPRTLIKFTAKLLDHTVSKGKLSVDVYLNFLRDLAAEIEVASRIVDRVDRVTELHTDVYTRRARLLFELCPLPLTREFLESELGKSAVGVIRGLLDAGILEEVALVRVDLADRELLHKLNEVRLQYGYPDVPIVDDLRKLSIELDSYYTKFEDGKPVMYIVLPLQAARDLRVKHIVAYKLRERVILKLDESVPELKVLDLVRHAYSLTARPRELAKTLAEALLREVKTHVQLSENIFVFCSGSSLDIRRCLVFLNVQREDDLELLLSKLTDIVRNGYVETSTGPVPFDALIVVVFAPSMSIPREQIEHATREWKIPGLSPASLLKLIVFDSGRVHNLRHAIAGYLIESSGLVVPQRFTHLVKAYRELIRDIEAFLNEARRVVLSELCLSIRRGRESKQQVLRKIVNAWINKEKLLDQPEVWRNPDGTPKLSKPERLFLEYLRSRGVSRLSVKEAEHLVRVLFPVHLWRELKEKDFIELCRLRGVLLPEGSHYLVYSPDTAREYVMRKLRAVKETHDRLCREVEIELNSKLRVKICEQLGEDQSLLKNLEAKITGLVNLGYDEDSLRAVASLLNVLEDIESRVSLQLRSLLEYEYRLRSAITNIREILKQMSERLNELSKLGLNSVTDLIRGKINREISLVEELIKTCDFMTPSQLYEMLSKLADSINASLVVVDNLGGIIKQLLDAETKCLKYDSNVVFGRLIVEDLNMVASLGHIEIELLLNLLENAKAAIMSAVSDFLTRVHEEENKMRLLVEWACKSKRIALSIDMCRTDIKENITDSLRRAYPTIVRLLSRELNLKEELVMKLALLRGNMVSVEDIARELGLDSNRAAEILDKLCDLGLAKRVYMIE